MSFPKQLKPLLEAKNFQLNIDLFCESFREKIEDFRITCCNNSIPETDFIDLTPKADFKPLINGNAMKMSANCTLY
jgi:hypothetical protein